LTDDLIMKDVYSFMDPSAGERLREKDMLERAYKIQAQMPFIAKN